MAVDYCDDGPDGVIVLDPFITFRTDEGGTRKGFRICWDPPEGEPLAQRGQLAKGGAAEYGQVVVASAGVSSGLMLLLITTVACIGSPLRRCAARAAAAPQIASTVARTPCCTVAVP